MPPMPPGNGQVKDHGIEGFSLFEPLFIPLDRFPAVRHRFHFVSEPLQDLAADRSHHFFVIHDQHAAATRLMQLLHSQRLRNVSQEAGRYT